MIKKIFLFTVLYLFFMCHLYPQKVKFSFVFNTFSLSKDGSRSKFIDSTYLFLGDNLWIEKNGDYRIILNILNGTLYFVNDRKMVFSGGEINVFFKEVRDFYDRLLKNLEKSYKIKKEDISLRGKIEVLLLNDMGRFQKFRIKSSDRIFFDILVDKKLKLIDIFSEKDFPSYLERFFDVLSVVERGFFSERKFKFEKKLNMALMKIYMIGFPVKIIEYRDNTPTFLTEIDMIKFDDTGKIGSIDGSYRKISFSSFEEKFSGD